MADNTTTYNVDVDIDVKTGKVEGSIAQLKELKKQLKQTAAGSDEFKKLYQQIDDLEDKLKGTKKASSDWIDTLESAGGPIGALGAGLNKLKTSTVSFGAALKATGIGLVVALVGALVAAFASSDEEMKKFQPLLIAMEQIFNGILSALQPVIDGFIQLATEVMPYITKAFKVAYSAVTALFQSLGKIGSALVKLFKGDFKGAWEDAKESVTGFSKNYDAAADRFDAGTKKMTKTQKENADKQRDLLLKRLEAQDKYDEAMLEKMKQQALALANTEQEKLDVEKAFAEKSYKLRQEALDKKLAAEKKNSPEYKTLQAEKIALEAEYIGKVKEFSDQQIKIDEEALKSKKEFDDKAREIKAAAIKDDLDRAIAERDAKYAKDLEDLEADKEFIKKSEEEKNSLRLALATAHTNDIAKLRTDDAIKKLQDQLMLDEAQLKALQEGSTEYFTQQRKIEDDAYQLKIKNAKDNAAQIEAIETEHKANLKNIDKAEYEAKKNLQLSIVDLYGQFGKSLQALAGKNKALAIAGLLVEQAAGIATIIINTQKAAAKAGYFTPLGIATLIAGAASVVTAVIATKKGIDQINQTQIPGGGGSAGGGGGVSMTPPAAPSVGATQAPQITGTTGGNNPTTQIAQTLAGATNKPIRAYVVSGDVSSQQALDRRTSKAATF
jgi:hypothetical protein